MTIPDVRDGLTRLDRIILVELQRASRELGRSNVPTALLYGRVVEHINISVDELNAALARLTDRGPQSDQDDNLRRRRHSKRRADR